VVARHRAAARPARRPRARAQAIATYRAALAIAPDHVGARRRLALDLLQAGDGPGALAALVAVARAAARTDAARALVEDDLAVALAVVAARAPADAEAATAIAAAIATTGVQPATAASRRVVIDLEATPNQAMASAGLIADGPATTEVDVQVGTGPTTRATSAAPIALAAPAGAARLWLTVRPRVQAKIEAIELVEVSLPFWCWR
jgi:hypothetical protein